MWEVICFWPHTKRHVRDTYKDLNAAFRFCAGLNSNEEAIALQQFRIVSEKGKEFTDYTPFDR